ncbi:MAG: hypothetical protein BHV59_08600 [Bifidobacterium sp. 56_9_plus]|nr:MAG: hypothetical protein BHV59_08600 [Bifidobacterium sp. 56_9_plus]
MIFIMSIAVCALQIFTHSIDNGTLWLIVTMLFLIDAGYGGGFSTLPVLLEQHFGMKSVSTVHGLALSAWAFAGLSGNQLALPYDGRSPPIQHADSDHHRTVRCRSRVYHRRDARHERQERQRLIITLNSNDTSFNTLTRRMSPSTPYTDVLGIRPQPAPRRGTDSGPVPRQTSSH